MRVGEERSERTVCFQVQEADSGMGLCRAESGSVEARRQRKHLREAEGTEDALGMGGSPRSTGGSFGLNNI